MGALTAVSTAGAGAILVRPNGEITLLCFSWLVARRRVAWRRVDAHAAVLDDERRADSRCGVLHSLAVERQLGQESVCPFRVGERQFHRCGSNSDRRIPLSCQTNVAKVSVTGRRLDALPEVLVLDVGEVLAQSAHGAQEIGFDFLVFGGRIDAEFPE